MRKLSIIITLVSCVLITSCGVLPQKNNFYTSGSKLELGAVGEKEKSIRKTLFKNFGNPRYNNPIKVSISEVTFTSSLFKKYIKATKKKDEGGEIVFNDTLITKPTFIVITIDNKVEIVNALNTKNINIFNYLKKSPNATLVNSLRLIPTQYFYALIKKSDAVYLKTDKQTKQRLHIYKDEKEIGNIDLSKQLIFGYELSSFCWKKTLKRKIEIATILSENQNCSNTTKRNPEELEGELIKSSFKF